MRNMRKKSKASGIMKLLKQGYTVSQTQDRMAVSGSYIHAIKKQMLAGVEAEVEPVATKTVIQPSYNPEAGEYIVVEGAKSISEIDAILNQRASTYGSFKDVATVAQQLKHVAASHTIAAGIELAHDQIEALEMIFTKIARIVNGNRNHVDNWVDIAGYAQLVADRLQGKVR